MQINPVDSRAIKMGNGMLFMLAKISSQYVQPGFIYKHDLLTKGLMYNDPSVLHLKFVNGQEKKYHMSMSTWRLMLVEINYINKMIEFERSMNGQDDELDD